ncbi:MAG: putative transposase [Celeribacter sp.]
MSIQDKDGQMKVGFTDEQIIGMIQEQDAGEKTGDVCRRHGIRSPTFYKYKSKYGGIEASVAKRLRALEDENGKLRDESPTSKSDET